MNRIDRLSAMLIMLQSSSSVKPKQMMARFGIGVRTVYRDIKALEEAGIPIAGDSRAGYSLVDGFKLPPLMFTQEEAIAFLSAQQLVDKFCDKSILENYNSGIEKIRAVMRIADRETIIHAGDNIGSLNFAAPLVGAEQSWHQTIMDSIIRRKKIQLDYQTMGEGERSSRVVDPIGIFFSMANWYLIAFCNLKNDYRTFRFSRIQKITSTDKDITTNHPTLDSFLQKLIENQDLQKVVIEVNKADYQQIDPQKYYYGLVSEKAKGDNIQLHFMTFSIERFARWYLSFADVASILIPISLKDRVREITNNMRIK